MFNSPSEGFPVTISDRQTDDRQTDGWPMTYSEREREFTFAKIKRDVEARDRDAPALLPYVFTMLLHEKDVCPSNNWTAK